MEIFLDCLPCILRQVLEASRMATDDEQVQQAVMDEALDVLKGYAHYCNSPDITRKLHRIVKVHTGAVDPYREVKQRDLQTALRLYPALRAQVLAREDTLYWGLKAAATGNVLDSAICADFDISRIDAEFEKPFAVCDLPLLREKLQTAKTLLVVGDNTGESVFDRLLLEQFPGLSITYAVRNAPVINDVTMEEAIASGLEGYARLISSGSDLPGTIVAECSPEFQEIFNSADIVISKGQGNFETLSDSSRGVFYLLKAKCPVIAGVLGVTLNDFVFEYRKGRPITRQRPFPQQ